MERDPKHKNIPGWRADHTRQSDIDPENAPVFDTEDLQERYGRDTFLGDQYVMDNNTPETLWNDDEEDLKDRKTINEPQDIS